MKKSKLKLYLVVVSTLLLTVFVNAMDDIFEYINFDTIVLHVEPNVFSGKLNNKYEDLVSTVKEEDEIKEVKSKDHEIRKIPGENQLNSINGIVESGNERKESNNIEADDFLGSSDYKNIVDSMDKVNFVKLEELNKKEDSVGKLINLCKVLESENLNLRKEIERINKEKEDYRNELNRLHNENTELKKKIIELQKIIDEMDKIKVGAIIDEEHRKNLMNKKEQ